MFYNYNKILSYNAFLNFLIGERGVGKTFGAVKFVTSQFIKKNEQFAYIRRYKSDLKNSVPTFFTSIQNNGLFEENHLYNKGNIFYCDNKICGYAMTLSTAQDLKSSNFDNVKNIIFDEFIINEGQKKYYLHNEVETFLNLIETIALMRKVKVFLLGNAGNIITNPYFLYFNLQIPYNTDIKLYKNGLILVQYMKNEEYRNKKRTTDFGKLVAGTSYEKFAIENIDNHLSKNFIEKKKGTAKFSFAFIYNNEIFGVWNDFKERKNLCFIRLYKKYSLYVFNNFRKSYRKYYVFKYR